MVILYRYRNSLVWPTGRHADVELLPDPFRLWQGLGRLIEYIPVSVTLGFTSGIGITIGTMQIKDFLGLQMAHVPEHYLQKVGALFMALPTVNIGDAAIGV